MKSFLLCAALLSSPAFSAEPGTPDAGPRITVSDIVITGVTDAGAPAAVDAGVVIDVIPSLDHPLTSAKGFYEAVRSGNGWLAAMFLLFFLVGLIRIVGKRIHAMISDTTTNVVLKLLQKFLKFIFDTKVGGWLLNWMSAVGGCLSTAALAGAPVDAASWKVSILASTGGTALIELKDDVLEWWDARAERLKAELAAKLAEAEKAAAALAAAPTPPSVPPVTPVEPPKA